MKLELPEHILRKIEDMARARNYEYDELVERYCEILNDGTLDEISFGNEDEKYILALKVLLKEVIDSVPTKKLTVVPIGYSGIRKTKRGDLMRSLFVISPKPKPHIARVTCMGKYVNIVNNIELFNKYTVYLGEFSDGTLTITNRTRFNNPEPVLNDINPETIDKLMQKLGVKRIEKLSDAQNHRSRVGSDGYIDDTDWRVVRGWILRRYIGKRQDDTEFGAYTIIDLDMPLEDRVTPDGRVISPGFTVWVSPELAKYDDGECDFYGSIDITNDGEAQMNAYLVVPVHVIK